MVHQVLLKQQRPVTRGWQWQLPFSRQHCLSLLPRYPPSLFSKLSLCPGIMSFALPFLCCSSPLRSAPRCPIVQQSFLWLTNTSSAAVQNGHEFPSTLIMNKWMSLFTLSPAGSWQIFVIRVQNVASRPSGLENRQDSPPSLVALNCHASCLTGLTNGKRSKWASKSPTEEEKQPSRNILTAILAKCQRGKWSHLEMLPQNRSSHHLKPISHPSRQHSG